MSQKKYVSLSKLSTFLDKLYEKFALLGHSHDDKYYTKTDIDDMELIAPEDIDTIFGQMTQYVDINEVTF